MNKEMKETVLATADYVNTNCEKNNKRVRICNAIAMLFFVIFKLLEDSDIYMNNVFVNRTADCLQGIAIGMLICGIVCSSRYGAKVRAFKKRIFAAK